MVCSMRWPNTPIIEDPPGAIQPFHGNARSGFIACEAPATSRQNCSSFSRALSAPPVTNPSAITTAFIAPALVALIASSDSRPSSSNASSTPQVNAPCAPPPCNARETGRVSGDVRAVDALSVLVMGGLRPIWWVHRSLECFREKCERFSRKTDDQTMGAAQCDRASALNLDLQKSIPAQCSLRSAGAYSEVRPGGGNTGSTDPCPFVIS